MVEKALIENMTPYDISAKHVYAADVFRKIR